MIYAHTHHLLFVLVCSIHALLVSPTQASIFPPHGFPFPTPQMIKIHFLLIFEYSYTMIVGFSY